MYSEHIISFIDIIGYADFVKSKSAEDVNRCVSILLDAFSAQKGDEVLGRRTTYFSDTIVTTIPLVAPNGTPQRHGTLYHELAALALAQADLFDRQGLWVRGAITIGDVHHTENRLFGPGIIEAYKLEQKSCFPRIVIDPKLLKRYFSSRELLAVHHRTHHMDFEYIAPLIRRERNRVRHVDYLLTLQDNLDNAHYFETLIRKHKSAILSGLKSEDAGIHSKYLWLAEYHNSTLRKLQYPPENRLFIGK
jgi:hypothetical protein